MGTANPLLPVPNPTKPYWRTELHRLDSHRSTKELPSACDTLIIGAGMSGVSVAYHLSRNSAPGSSPSMVLLEARQVCSGATGRNGGHVKVKTTTLLSILANNGPKAAESFADYVRAQIYAIKDIVEQEGLDCEFELRRSYDVFLSNDKRSTLKHRWDEAVKRGDRWTRERDFIDTKSAERLTSIQGAKFAFSTPACSFWPYKFVTQLLEKAMDKNPSLNLQTETPVLGIKSPEGGEDAFTIVQTNRGSIRAKKVVFATNGYTAGLLPQYRGVITPYKGTAALLAPPSGGEPVYPHLSNTYNIDYGLAEYQGETVDYLNPRPDGGIVVGGANWLFREKRDAWMNNIDDSTLMQPVMEARYFEGYMQRAFRGWEDSGTILEKVWTGSEYHPCPHGRARPLPTGTGG